MAGELVSTLVDAVACPVCGSHEHPAPAEHADSVSADDIVVADAMRDDAAQRERHAAEKLSALRAQRAEATGRTDGRDLERAEAESATAGEKHARSLAAAEALRALAVQLVGPTVRTERLDAERAVADAEHTAAHEELALLGQRRLESVALIADARGTIETVADRLAEAEEHVVAARALSATIAERDSREATAADADTEEEALAVSAFDDAAGVDRALRPPSVRDTFDAWIAEHTRCSARRSGPSSSTWNCAPY